MKNPKPYLVLLLSVGFCIQAKAQGSGDSNPFASISAILGGFFILFFAIFFFAFGVKTVVNYKKQKWTAKKILIDSLVIGFTVSLVGSLLLYIVLSTV